jgi:hypothetical protein
MKNVNGLGSAMRLVESACEKGEITIIGEGGVPTPVELYKKCVAYINKQYGVDILNLVLKEQKLCECNGSCATVIVEVDEDEDTIVIDITNAKKYLEGALEDLMPYADGDYIDEVISNIICDFESANDNDEVKDMNATDIVEIVLDELCDKFSGLAYDTLKEVADKVGEYIGYHYVLM